MADHEPEADAGLLLRYLGAERRALTGLVAVLVVAMTLPLAGPVLVGRFVDRALDTATTGSLVVIAVLFLATTLAGDGLQLVVTWLSVRLAWRVGNTLRLDLCRHALGLDLDWHADHSPGQLIERIDGDIDVVTRFSSTAVLQLVGNAILVVGVVAISAFIDWRASLLIAVTVAGAVAVMAKMRRLAVPFYDTEREVQGQLYGDVEERLGGLEDLRANGAGGWAEHKLHGHSANWWRATRRAALRGELVVITGSVGSGKSVLLRAILGLVAIAGGSVTWNGSDVTDPSTWFVPPRSAYVPQASRLFSEPLADTILFGLASDGLGDALRLVCLDDDLADMPHGLATTVGPKGVRLSGGQAQRAATARAFVRRPELLVVDDLSSALDVTTEARLWNGLFAAADGNLTVLAVSHRPRLLDRADQVIELHAGHRVG